MGKVGISDVNNETNEKTALDKILRDEPSQSEGSLCGHVCKCLAPNAMLVLCGIAAGVFCGMGTYFILPQCPPNMCEFPVTSFNNDPGASAGMFLLMTMGAVFTAIGCVYETARFLTENEHSEKEENCYRRTWKCIANELTPSPKVVITASTIMMGFFAVMGVYFALPRCSDKLCITYERVNNWEASRKMFIVMAGFLVITKVACVFGDILAGKRNCACL